MKKAGVTFRKLVAKMDSDVHVASQLVPRDHATNHARLVATEDVAPSAYVLAIANVVP